MKISGMTDRQILEYLAVEVNGLKDGQAKLESGQTKLEAGQSKLESGQVEIKERLDHHLDLLDAIAATTGQSAIDIQAIQTTQADHTDDLQQLKESSKHQLDLLDTIAAATGANTSDLLTLTHRKSRLEKLRR